MSHSKSVYGRQLVRANRTSLSRGQGDEPGAGEDTGLGEQEFGTDQNPTEPQDNNQPQHRGGYSMIPPNESRRSQLQRMANKELEELKQWKEAHRPGPINMTPAQLGGCVSETDARRQQQISLRGSKLRQRAKKEEHDRIRKEAENLEYQKMKEIQREKANKLEEKRRQEEKQRKSQLQTMHYQTNQQFFQRVEANRFDSQSPLPPNNPGPAPSWVKKEEHDRERKEAENLEYQKMKEIQREKANKLEEKRWQEEEQRKSQLQTMHYQTNQQFFQRVEANRFYSQSPLPPNNPGPAPSWVKKEEHDRERKEAENLEYQKMKEIQREKANKLEEKRWQEEEQRKSQLQTMHYQTNQQFFQRVEANRFDSQSPLPPNNPGSAPSWAKSQTSRETQRQTEQQKLQQQEEEERMKSDLLTEMDSQMEAARQKCLQEEHRRKNSAFLDNLERRQRSSENFHSFAPPLSNESVEHDTKQHVAASTFYEDLEKVKQHSARIAIEDAACSDTPEGFPWTLHGKGGQDPFPGS
ncbi:epithelial-stromal interaction protein 1 isoform X2 [Heptranchias perlo]|uniref:epithelial-stromal interaction protein 1 isoform X2 n=1 Tax=Heptranchias perlo TaxID=212740 RepID=UPI003559D577